MTYKTILVEYRESAAVVTLNRPEKLNAHNRAMTDELDDVLADLSGDDRIRAVIVTGAGDKAFCAGADIHELANLSLQQLAERQQNIMHWTWRIAACPKPVIGAINGLAYGGGAMMSSLFDLRIGCERTKFRFLGAARGRLNSTWSLPLIIGWAKAKDLLLTGRMVDAREALRIGLLNQLVPARDLMKTALSTARTIAANDRTVVREIKVLLNNNMRLREMLLAEMAAVPSLPAAPVEDTFSDFLKRNPARLSLTSGSSGKAKKETQKDKTPVGEKKKNRRRTKE